MIDIIGYSTSDLVEAMEKRGIHCSLAAMKEFVIEIQQRALSHVELNHEEIKISNI